MCFDVSYRNTCKQHYELSKKIFKNNIKIEFLTGKTEYKLRKNILDKLKNGKIDLLIGTHSLFQKKINFKKLGLVVIDEQHKFGVKQRSDLAQKGGIIVMYCLCLQLLSLEQ